MMYGNGLLHRPSYLRITVFNARAKSARSARVSCGSAGTGRVGATQTSYGYRAQTGTTASTCSPR